MSIKVSIIIPIFNVETFLRSCLDSVLTQSLKDIEFICVNDGSTDHSLNILHEYAARDDRIVIIDKENGGYGKAMNIGIETAKGEYIGIVEPDDFVSEGMFEGLYRCAVQYDLDFVKEDFYRFKTINGKTYREYVPLSNFVEDYHKVFTPRDKKESFDFTMNTWSGIYKRRFLEDHQIRHNETPGASYQDNGFWFQTFVFANRAMILDQTGYWCRRDNPNSSVNNVTKVYAMNKEYDYIRGILEKDPDNWELFKGIYWRKRFLGCEWTLYRIDESYLKEYLHDVASELKKGYECREFSENDFEGMEWYRVREVMNEEFVKPTDVEGQLHLLLNSRSYKLGRFLTSLPRSIRSFVKKEN